MSKSHDMLNFAVRSMSAELDDEKRASSIFTGAAKSALYMPVSALRLDHSGGTQGLNNSSTNNSSLLSPTPAQNRHIQPNSAAVQNSTQQGFSNTTQAQTAQSSLPGLATTTANAQLKQASRPTKRTLRRAQRRPKVLRKTVGTLAKVAAGAAAINATAESADAGEAENRLVLSGTNRVQRGYRKATKSLTKKTLKATKTLVSKASYAKRSLSAARQAASATKGAATTIRSTSTATKILGQGIRQAKGASALLGAAPVVLGICASALALIMLVGLVGAAGAASAQEGLDTLSPTEQAVALFLRSKGVDDLHTAAIMGNIYKESSFNPSSIEGASGEGHGLCQWSFGRKLQLYDYATAKGTSWDDMTTQFEFLEAELWGSGPAAPYANIQMDWDAFMAQSGLIDATLYFLTNFERANPLLADGTGRCQAALRYYVALSGGSAGFSGGEEYAHASSRQQALINAAYTTPWPGAAKCATFVLNAFANAGEQAPYGDANDMYWAYCTSSDPTQLKVGMLVATASTTWGYWGGLYGHVGIYQGDGKIINSVDAGVGEMTLESFSQAAKPGSPLRWGWACGIDLSA